MKQIKMNNAFTFFLALGLLASCGVKRHALDTGIEMPKSFENKEAVVLVDTVKKATATPEDWRVFFTDPLLVQLIDTAIANNQDYQIALQKVQQARSGVQFTKGIRLPDLNLTVAAGVRKFGDYTIDGVGNYDTQFSTNLTEKQQIPNPVPDYYLGLGTSWEIDLWGKLGAKKRAALARFLAQDQGKNLVLTNLIAEVALSYYKLILLDQKSEIIEENILLQENALEVIEFQKDMGKSNQLAIELISAQVLSAKTMLLEIEQEIIEEEAKLNFLLGRYPQPIARSAFDPTQAITKAGTAGIPSDLLLNRPDIQAAGYELKAANADVKAAKAAFYPSLTINGAIGFQAFRAAVTFDPASLAFNVFGGLVAPLLNQRALKAQLMESKASQRAAYLNYEKTILNAFTEVYQLLRLQNNYTAMQELKTEQVNLLKQAIETSRTLFTSGRAGYLEIITSQQNFLSAQMELLELYRLQNQNNVILYKSIGGGWKK